MLTKITAFENATGVKCKDFVLVLIFSELLWNVGLALMLIDRGMMIEWEWSIEVLSRYSAAFDSLNFSLSTLFILGFLINRVGSIITSGYVLLFQKKDSLLSKPVAVFAWLDLSIALAVTFAFFVPTLNKSIMLLVGLLSVIFLFILKYFFIKFSVNKNIS